MTSTDEVLEFIHRRFPTDNNWLNGNCYYFALILHNRFPHLYMCYMPVDGHFVVCDLLNHTYYDWAGRHTIDNNILVLWDNFQDYDALQYERIIEDCTK